MISEQHPRWHTEYTLFHGKDLNKTQKEEFEYFGINCINDSWYLESKFDNPNYDYQEQLESIGHRIHIG